MAEKNASPLRPVSRGTGRVITPRRLKWRHHLAAFAIVAGFRLLSCTWRLRFIDEHGVLEHPGGPVIFCCWHNRLALSMRIWERVQRSAVRSAGLVALISASHDGGVLARTLQYFGVEAVRGSSSRRGPQALLELTSWTERGYSIAITPDGPRGPCYRVSEGAIGLAQVSQFPIVPVSTRVRWKFSTGSWDRFQIPLPFARCEVRIGQPLRVSGGAADAERAHAKQELKARLDRLTED
jgi:lysophospholipid acyltransferase (LPLAT)-like uncharacterized protein